MTKTKTITITITITIKITITITNSNYVFFPDRGGRLECVHNSVGERPHLWRSFIQQWVWVLPVLPVLPVFPVLLVLLVLPVSTVLPVWVIPPMKISHPAISDYGFDGYSNSINLLREYYQQYACEFALEYYPFDTQVCHMVFALQVIFFVFALYSLALIFRDLLRSLLCWNKIISE